MKAGRSRGSMVTWCSCMGLLLEGGLPLVRAAEVALRQTADGRFRDDLEDLVARVRKGLSLADAMAAAPDRFPRSLVEAVRGGEASGRLDETLLRWAEFASLREGLQARVAGALVYPAVVLLCVAGVAAFLLAFIVPKMVRIFAANGAVLPWQTQAVMKAAALVLSPWTWGLLLAGALAAALALRVEGLRLLAEGLARRLPVVGGLLRSWATATFCGFCSVFLRGGISVPRALELCSGLADTEGTRRALTEAASSVTAGRDLTLSLVGAGVVGDDVACLVGTGAQTDALARVMETAAAVEAHRVEETTGRVVAVLEPVTVLALGLVVTSILVAVYLPVITMASAMVR